MKWINLAQLIMLIYITVLVFNFETITTTGMIVLEVFLIATIVISLMLFIKNLKNKNTK